MSMNDPRRPRPLRNWEETPLVITGTIAGDLYKEPEPVSNPPMTKRYVLYSELNGVYLGKGDNQLHRWSKLNPGKQTCAPTFDEETAGELKKDLLSVSKGEYHIRLVWVMPDFPISGDVSRDSIVDHLLPTWKIDGEE